MTTFLEMIKKIFQDFFISVLERNQRAGPMPCDGGGAFAIWDLTFPFGLFSFLDRLKALAVNGLLPLALQ
jgi:hypothetical protein